MEALRSRIQQKLREIERRVRRFRPGAMSKHIAALERAIEDNRRQLQIHTVMSWIAQTEVAPGPLVSVVLPTRDRCELLPRAIASVVAQSYLNWELLIVDDGSVDGTSGVLAANEDRRLHRFLGQGAGVCAARNIALQQARGELITYLDDDNIMHPQWLKSVVWGFQQRPGAAVLYGAFVVDDSARLKRQGSGELPQTYFFSYDHSAVAVDNIADISCIAHRANLPDARFDESLREMGDWDLFLRLTRDAPPLALPAVACFYTTDAPNRLSNGPTFHTDLAAVRSKNRR